MVYSPGLRFIWSAL